MAGEPIPSSEEATLEPLHAVATVDPLTQSPPLLITVGEVARRLNTSQRHAWTLVARGDVASVLVGGRIRRVSVFALADYVKRLEAESGGSDTT